MYEFEKRYIKKCYPNFTDEQVNAYILGFNEFQDEIDKLKRQLEAADVQLVKHGRWAKDEKGVFHHCSECGGETFRDVDSWGLDWQEYYTDYCPNCRAKMDGCDDNV